MIEVASLIEKIDQAISRQLRAIMHHDKFLQLEASWRGIRLLVESTEVHPTLKIRLIDMKKRELEEDLSAATAVESTRLYEELYQRGLALTEGEPYTVLLGDFEFSKSPQDLATLRGLSEIAARCFCPFIAAASPQFFEVESYKELENPIDLEGIAANPEYASWNSFRDLEYARYVVLTMPRVLARLPYINENSTLGRFSFSELSADADEYQPNMCCWMSSSYVLGMVLVRAFQDHGWCSRIIGTEGGGRVDGLPCIYALSEDRQSQVLCPTEIQIPFSQLEKLSSLGVLPLLHFSDTAESAFTRGSTTHRPRIYDQYDKTADAAICARLPYIMTSSRIVHYMICIARDFKRTHHNGFVDELSRYLQSWVFNYVNPCPPFGDEEKARYPLFSSKVEVTQEKDSSVSYKVVVDIWPYLPIQELDWQRPDRSGTNRVVFRV